MNSKVLFLVLVFALAAIAPQALGQAAGAGIDFDKVTVEFYGSWQWGQGETYKEYTLNDLKNTDFALDIDEAGERRIDISYALGNSILLYRIEALWAASQGTDTVFNITKNGQSCVSATHTLPITSTKKIDFSRECGLKFEAEWESLTFETDVEIHNIEISPSEINAIKNDFLKQSNAGELIQLANEIKAINRSIRTLDVLNPNDFTPKIESGLLRIHASPVGFDEGDATFKNRLLAITKNKTIIQVILINNEIFENLLAFAPVKEIKIDEFKTPTQLVSALNDPSKFKEIVGVDAEENGIVPEWLDEAVAAGGVSGVTAIAGTAGTYYLLGTSSALAAAGTLFPTSAATVATAGSTATTIASSTGLAVAGATGAIITAGAVAIGGSIWYFNETDATKFEDITINFGENLVVADEQTINYILYWDKGALSFATPGSKEGKVKISLPIFVKEIEEKFKDVDEEKYKEFVKNPIEGIKTGLKVYKANANGTKTGNALSVTLTVEGDDTLVIDKLTKGENYAFVIDFVSPFPTKHTDIPAAFKVIDVDAKSNIQRIDLTRVNYSGSGEIFNKSQLLLPGQKPTVDPIVATECTSIDQCLAETGKVFAKQLNK